MLTNVGGDDGIFFRTGRYRVDQSIVRQRVIGIRHIEREFLLQRGNQRTPRRTLSGHDTRRQLGQHFSDVALNGDMRLLDFTQLGAVDIHVDDFGVRAEFLGFTNRPVIKTRA